ncbi:MAG: histidine--tRNA ligase [Candidatus Doudnabacteria bacterium RIFCSPHIGHO2_02_FULL_48_21]|uniref:Histidine--tRNA ligase n=1 Tax=Candidatus Doudnabacteria bacterium RIFCSPLOWO2_02_FULL_48_13 TaxID=1817845 RepID=A0A1F5Q8U6_9BACT|nr:MAG: histidine--tRNA ligase [Candidatus Doudnabacteria bacterium RIFCSPHIGHO2_01_48_18]OGE93196.1 MAG: histidine--tRNA ligase [Candidatus Doudnabacteria bacterium RIFCSPHIGHO2_02_FULL_48_21]OGE98546.1 MAG: histidine--tRNA ligase [Candidatus Doudnabacteria bacterium RIFCSPLOWO2_02_FULL_48_13]OGF01840.1 MAG: histidine--tRNA ligase [Candidatus Doudnabacteria bacterium RIFCSPLOWO2_12_FULL_47_12]
MSKKDLQTLKGFRDFLPGQALAREEVFKKIRAVFQKYGFLPLETPVLEYKEILSGKYGEESEKLMYQFKDRGERDVAMRYDLTVPLARVVAQYQNDLAMPFKRYQIAPVWRADNTQKGRYREFYQCDVDVIGSSSIIADAEVIAALAAALTELDLPEFIIRLNNRKLLDAILKNMGLAKGKIVEAIRAIDKLDKIGEEKVREDLALLGLGTEKRKELFEILNLGLEGADDIEKKLMDYEGAGELAQLVEILLDWGVKNFRIDLGLARGLDYYTGTIFEIILPDAPQYGSIAGGGRYDNLVGMFSGKPIPAVGGSIGVDRLLSALEELELIKYDLVSDVLVCNLEEDLEEEYLRVVKDLRDANIKVDFYYTPDKLDKQLKYANKKNINFVVIIGPDEAKNAEATVKNLNTGKQKKLKQKGLGLEIRKI